jgi:uncharacterized protein YoxC
MVDPFGTKELSKEMEEFNAKLSGLVDTMNGLGKSTADLSNFSKELGQALSKTDFQPMASELKGMRQDISELKDSITEMTGNLNKNLSEMNENIARLSNTFEKQMMKLVDTLNRMGESLSQGMIQNVRDNLSIGKIIQPFLKPKKDE